MQISSQLAPTGTLRVAVWMVPYFARMHVGGLRGIIPDLAAELAQRAGVKLDLVKFENPARIITAEPDAKSVGERALRNAALARISRSVR